MSDDYRQHGIDLAARMTAYLRQRLEDVTARAREGRASASQLREAAKACESSARALRNLKRRRAA